MNTNLLHEPEPELSVPFRHRRAFSGSRRTRRLPGEAQPTLVPRDASCTDGRTTDTHRHDDTPAAGAESAKPQVNGGVGGARGGIRTPDLPITRTPQPDNRG